MDVLKGFNVQEVKQIILRYGDFKEDSETNTDEIATVFGITRFEALALLDEIAKDSPSNITKATSVSMHGGNKKSPVVKFTNIGFPSSIEALLAKVEAVIYSGIGVEFNGLLTMFSKQTFIVGVRLNLFASEITIGFVKNIFPEMALVVRTRAAGNRSSYSAALGILTFCPKAAVHLKIGTCAVSVSSNEQHPFHCWDIVQMWSGPRNELALIDVDRNKSFFLDDTSFNVVEEVDLWRRYQPQGGYFGSTTIIHRLPYKSGVQKLVQPEASDVGFAREMEIGGIVQALEDYCGCSCGRNVTPKIGSLNLVSEIIHVTTGERQKWQNDSEKAEKCLLLGEIAADVLHFIKVRCRTCTSSSN